MAGAPTLDPNVPSGMAIEPATPPAGVPTCENTGFEAMEPLCQWEAGFGICGSTFTCRDTAVDGPYSTSCAAPPTVQPDNCCVDNPHPVNDWFLSATSQHCQEPHISTANPASGSQHLRFQHSTQSGNPAGCTTPDVSTGAGCRQSVFTPNVNPNSPGTRFNPGITTTSFDVARDLPAGMAGMRLDWLNRSNSEGEIGQRVVFDTYGYVFAMEYALDAYVYIGALSGGGMYDHFDTQYDVCGDSITYYWNNQLMYVATGSGSQIFSIEQEVWLADNASGAIYDFDNLVVERDMIAEPVCPCSCGGGGPCVGKECDTAGGDDVCCPGQCGLPGGPGECECPDPTNTLANCSPRELVNGVNGPFVSDGGFYSYTADAPFTSVSTCGSDYDTQIFWNVTPDCEQYETFNDDCFEGDYGGYQQPGDPNASCYGGSNAPLGYEGCICNATLPGQTYLFLIAEWDFPPAGTTLQPPFCSRTVVEISKKTGCGLGEAIEGGACCDQLAGTCIDGVEAAACADPYDNYFDNKLCGMVECEPLPGACCNAAPGTGGTCAETMMAECPTSQYQSWTVGATCGGITCEEVIGSCCNTLSGTCSPEVTQGECGAGADFVWTEGGTCSTCVARTGACCVHPSVTEAVCTDGQTLAQCDAAGGVWSDGEPCAAAECTPEFMPIPAVSEWGLVVLGLVLMIVGKVYATRPKQC